MDTKKDKREGFEELMIVEPMGVAESTGDSDPSMLKLQLTMATNSINHEYARMEFDDTLDVDRKEELLNYMNECREKYFEARESLMVFDSTAVQEFEADLLIQKKTTLNQFNA